MIMCILTFVEILHYFLLLLTLWSKYGMKYVVEVQFEHTIRNSIITSPSNNILLNKQ